MKTFYVTTPIYYANSLPHIGHLYATTAADVMARRERQRGATTYFLTGTDEHGVNIQRAAERVGRTPREQVDFVVEELKKVFAAFRLDGAHGGYDIFMRTTEPFHYEGVQNLWRRIAQSKTPKGRDALYKGFYEGWFCAACATFKTEDEYAKPEREGDAPKCLVHETPLDRVSEESYFFRLSDYDEALLALYESRPGFVWPESRRNEVKSFVRAGLQDLSVSRLKTSVSWAIPVPDDPAHTVYIWLDALTNYVTAIGWGNEERERAVGFGRFWPALHLVGKDILRQHTIYWPAFLMAAGIELPRAVLVHGMWLDRDGRKMSKTLRNAVDPFLLARMFQTDAVRYFLMREMVFGQDSRFSYAALVERANSDLASGLGNLAARTLTMIGRYCEGRAPADGISDEGRLQAKRVGVEADAQGFASSAALARDQFVQQCDEFAYSRALETAWGVIARSDKLISDAKPWELAKDESQREALNAVLYRAAETLRWLAVMLYPFMPESSRALWHQLGQTDDPERYDPSQLQWGGLRPGTRTGEVSPLFPRLDKKKIMDEIKKETSSDAAASDAPTATLKDPTAHRQPAGAHATEADAVPGSPAAGATKPEPPQRGATEADHAVASPPLAVTTADTQPLPRFLGMPDAQPASQPTQPAAPEGVVSYIGIEDFVKVEMRVGQILTAERVPKSDKLLRFTVDVGEPQPRQILAGIAEHYEPAPLVGRKIVVVSNLRPRKLRGFESQGMVLAASVGDEGRPVLATFTEDVPNGARLK
ncbi:MAG TPA: methionine--tRNA ligase [Pyrinomonadaceae bacterium]|nr:methionine--tRNA ligase [Pyrinomonadaceae bacterium]